MLRRFFESSAAPVPAGPYTSVIPKDRPSVTAAALRQRSTPVRGRVRSLEIIPVLEICGGRVIDPEATAPEADDLPLPPVASSSVPFEAVDMLVRSAPVRRICILDRDAMAGRPAQMYTLAALETRFPRIEFWVETGARDAIAVKTWLSERRGKLVLGSASQSNADLVEACRDHGRIVLALDHRGAAGDGPADIFERPGIWPERVIVRTTQDPATGTRASLARLAAFKAMAGPRLLYSVGSLRDPADMAILQGAGIAGAMVAPAQLHALVLPQQTLV